MTDAPVVSPDVSWHIPPVKLNIEWVQFDRRDVIDIAEHLDGRARAAVEEIKATHARKHPRRSGERAAEFQKRVDEDADWETRDYLPRFSVALRSGETVSSADMSALLQAIPPRDATQISMSIGRGYGDGLEVDLPLDGRGGSVEIRYPSREVLDAEAGYFRRKLERRTWLRYFSAASLSGLLLWVVLPTAALIFAILRQYDRGLSFAQALNVVAFFSVVIGGVLLVVAVPATRILVPKVQVEGLGPHQSVRRWAEAIVLGLASSALFATFLIVIPWVLGG